MWRSATAKWTFAACWARRIPNVLEWAIVELDACDSDMMTAVERSYRYLTRHGLAAGRV